MKSLMKKSVILGLVSLLFLTSLFSVAPGKAGAQIDLNVSAAILVDADSGKIIYQKQIDTTLWIASMTKMMSEYLILEAIEDGKITWDQTVPISNYVRSLSLYTDLSNVPLRQDETYTVKELYESVAIYSANASTIALAELIAGSETNFVKMMNDKADELDLVDYKFVNSTGLNNSDLLGQHPEGTAADEENMMSARATAKLAYHLIHDYPEVLDTASIPYLVFKEGTEDEIMMDNWNWMLPGTRIGQEHDFAGVDGLKTGYTSKAKNNFTSTATRNGMRLISVVMGAETRADRFDETARLLEYGFNNFSKEEIIPANFQAEGQETLPVSKGKEKEVSISTSEPLTVLLKKGEEELYTPKLQLDTTILTEEGELLAPVAKDEAVGVFTVDYSGEIDYEYLTAGGETLEQAVVKTDSDVQKAGWFSLAMRGVGGFFSGIWTSIADTVKGWF
ncbi:serine hydrolase [Anaerobacillus sp. MEB173]|uniref:serine hydrolase n=1 Tax=Anaerobacillus sp. MEB173 TaxID=3383345 RepID=UPI003F8D9450